MQARAGQIPLRVTSISPGVVETEFNLVQNFHRDPEAANARYKSLRALQSLDIAHAVLYVLAAPAHVDVNDVLMRPTDQVN